MFRGKDLLNDFFAPNGTYYTVAWNKLYRAEVWKLLHYPEGRLHEDDFVAHRLFWRCDKAVSYTHLDVYKRQVLWWMTVPPMKAPSLPPRGTAGTPGLL